MCVYIFYFSLNCCTEFGVLHTIRQDDYKYLLGPLQPEENSVTTRHERSVPKLVVQRWVQKRYQNRTVISYRYYICCDLSQKVIISFRSLALR